LYRAEPVQEEHVPEEAGDVETTRGTSATPESNSESSDLDSDESSTDTPAEGATRYSEEDTPSTGEAGSDRSCKADEPVPEASEVQEAAVRKNLEKLKKLDEYDDYILGVRNINY
jgi:hypothetical protein